MRTAGVEVRPLRQITGEAHFNEVFFTDVRVPAACAVGAVNAGWGVALTTLTNERNAIGSGMGTSNYLMDAIELARRRADTPNPILRQRLADAYVHDQVINYLRYRALTALSMGKTPGPESSVMKLAFSQQAGRLGNLVVDLLGAPGMLTGSDAPDGGMWQRHFLFQWGIRLGGGTDEIQRNVIGERVLGLPREPRVDIK
jgi:alkylation response protein AidB-like acyl-CoA dehydrogenase